LRNFPIFDRPTTKDITAIAIENNLILVTGNTKHYQKIQSLGYPLQLDNWRD
jgi:tRNA(fMet)-specific endonuclease VapC